MDFLKFFTEAFSKMPKWVRVFTWLVLLILVVYLYVTPRFINGQMVAKLENGGTIEYRGATLRTSIEGRVLKFKTNEDGFWSVPLVSRLPFQPVRLQVYHEDAKAWYDVELAGKTVWSAGFETKEIRLEIKNNPPAVELTVVASNASGIGFLQTVLRVIIGSPVSAWAQPAPVGQLHVSKTETIHKLNTIIAGVTGRVPSAIGSGFRLTGQDAPSYSNKLRIIDEAEKEFKIKIPDEEWQAMSTAGELADYIYKAQQK
jgi:hypothetical protein